MKIDTKKLNNGFEMSVFGIGTWEMGGRTERDENYTNEEKDISALQTAIKMGVNRFDTAEVYAQGYSEEILGKAIRDFDRGKLFIVSKVSNPNLQYDNVIRSAKNTLKRLGTDYLDLYLIHAPNPDIPIEETMRALDYLKERGLIKNIGVCNFGVESLEKAQSVTKNKIVLNQVHYNLIFREPVLAGVLEYCQNNDVFLEAWRPLQKGDLTHSGITILDEICEKYNKTQSQIAINWLISQKNVITLTKTSNLEHLEDDLGALGWGMEENDVKLLMEKFPIQLDRSNAVRLG
ncbi:MAG: aldo/keto reductase [Parcubacteria group bacterium]